MPFNIRLVMCASLLIAATQVQAGNPDSITGDQRILSAPNFLRSDIIFTTKENSYVNYADISVADPLFSCPLEDPPDLQVYLDQLKLKVVASVSKIKDTRGDRCNALQSRVASNTNQISLAMQNQFMMTNFVTANLSQTLINRNTQQGMALNSLVLTLSDMVALQCIQSIDDKVAIQKLLGQVVMLSGLFMGGWTGIGLAMGGQILGNIPFFHNDVDQALEMLQLYDEKNRRADFLCIYRQMMKMTVLLFSDQNDIIIHGLDLSFQSGQTLTTMNSLASYRKKHPDLLDDMILLNKFYENSEELYHSFNTWDPKTSATRPMLEELEKWCRRSKNYFSADHIIGLVVHEPWKAIYHHPAENAQVITASMQQLYDSCTILHSLKYPAPEELPSFIDKAYWHLKTLRNYYGILLDASTTLSGEILGTLMSEKYFNKIRDDMNAYRSEKGNLSRLNFRRLTNKLGKGLARKSMKLLMKLNYKNFTKHKILHAAPINDIGTRRRALWGMLDICQTLDPSLVKLYNDIPEDRILFRKWQKYCVGPKSKVCKPVLKSADKDLLLNARYGSYFNSLCNT